MMLKTNEETGSLSYPSVYLFTSVPFLIRNSELLKVYMDLDLGLGEFASDVQKLVLDIARMHARQPTSTKYTSHHGYAAGWCKSINTARKDSGQDPINLSTVIEEVEGIFCSLKKEIDKIIPIYKSRHGIDLIPLTAELLYPNDILVEFVEKGFKVQAE